MAAALTGHEIRPYRDDKVIHDAVHGSSVFDEYEIAIIDLPLMQRLRRIRQLGLVLQVYPSGGHSRFEHSLGVCVMTGRLVDALNQRDTKLFSTEKDRRELRLAALLHDIGHMPFSHITEELLRQQIDFELIRDELGYAETTKEHEVLGALMVRSEAFRTRVVEPLRKRYSELDGVDFDRVSDYIVGRAAADEDYKARIISGVLDADKMDYILRDCHMTGLKMSVDIDRILQTVRVVSHEGKRALAIHISGVSTVEQMLFDKMLLNFAVYHHQKVRATECTIKGIFEHVIAARGRLKLAAYDLVNPLELVQLTDDDVLAAENHDDPTLRTLVQRLTHRDLLMRCAVITEDTIDKERSGQGYRDLWGLQKDLRRLTALRVDLAEYLGIPTSDVWIDLPKPLNMTESANFLVDQSPGGEPKELGRVFPIGEWLTAYNANKLRGHVFVPRASATAETFERVRTFLREQLGLELSENARPPLAT